MAYLLVQPTVLYKYVIDGLRIPNYVSLTVYGDDSGLQATECPAEADLEGKKYIFFGGHEYTTDDPALLALWQASGFTATPVVGPLYPSDSTFPSTIVFPGA